MKENKFFSSENYINAIEVIENLLEKSDLLGYSEEYISAMKKTRYILASECSLLLHQEAGAEVTLEMEEFEDE